MSDSYTFVVDMFVLSLKDLLCLLGKMSSDGSDNTSELKKSLGER